MLNIYPLRQGKSCIKGGREREGGISGGISGGRGISRSIGMEGGREGGREGYLKISCVIQF